MPGVRRRGRLGAENRRRDLVTRAEALVAAAFRGFAEALVAADEKAPKKEKGERPSVIPVDAVRKAVQEALPGIIAQMADETEPLEAVDRPFGLGDIEEALDDRERRQRGSGDSYDPNQPGSGGWRNVEP